MKTKRLISLMMICSLYACSYESRKSNLLSEEDDYNSAVELFSKRSDSLDSLSQAKNFVKSKLASAAPAKQSSIELSVLLARLTYFEATRYYVLPAQKEARRKIFQENITYIDKYLSPEVLKFQNPAYYYFKLQSLLAYADDSTALEQLQLLTPIKKLLEDKVKAGGWETYAGGGLYRLEAQINSREYLIGVPGSYNPAFAYQLIDKALAAEAYPGDYAGDLYCENYLSRAELEFKVTKNRVKPVVYATELVELFSGALADSLIPVWQLPETAECIAKAQSFISDKGVTVRDIKQLTQDRDFEFRATAYFSSNSTIGGQVSLEAYCIAEDLSRPPVPIAGAVYLNYVPSMAGQTLQQTLSLKSDSIPCIPRYLVFNSERMLSASFVEIAFIDKGITNEKYASDTRQQLEEVYAIQLVNYSISMAQQALAQPNMFCNIQAGAKNPRVEPAYLQKVKADYFNVFGVAFNDPDHQFSCPPAQTLKGEVKFCTDNPAKSTPFCNSYRLYSKALSWISEAQVETNRRLSLLKDKESKIYKDLDSLKLRLQDEETGSEDVLGEADQSD